MLEADDTAVVPEVDAPGLPPSTGAPIPAEPLRVMPSRRWLAGVVAAALIAGFLGGLVAGTMQEGPRGSVGPVGQRGLAGPRGPAGAAADVDAKLAEAAKQTDSKIEDLGMCWEANYVYSNVTYVNSVSLYSASRKPNGTLYCPTGTYIPVKASPEGGGGD
ncbi:MAG: hypothetical protein JWN67_4023 [Actinomycetia bacterium]|nr:hypothetical protein [Actinomycetes bacterium]